jgi:hypothetical protein
MKASENSCWPYILLLFFEADRRKLLVYGIKMGVVESAGAAGSRSGTCRSRVDQRLLVEIPLREEQDGMGYRI